MTSLVTLSDIEHSFGAQQVLCGIDLAIAEGSYTVLLGPSGSGKTTLLSMLGGFLVPDKGDVRIDGTDVTTVPPAKRPTATVFQDYALFPHMSVEANVAFGLKMRGVKAPERLRSARNALDLVGLVDLARRRPHALSGGQRQRVALARALVIEPKVLLLDEPLGALDLALRRQMQDELKATQKRVGTAFVHVTHDQEEAMALADTVVVMNAGRIEDAGPAERVYRRPASRFTATFMGESTLLEGRVLDVDADAVRVESTLGVVTVAMTEAEGRPVHGADVAIALRPECIRIGIPAALDTPIGTATITDIAFQGSFKRAHARTNAGERFLIKVASDTPLQPGDTVQISARRDDLILLTR